MFTIWIDIINQVCTLLSQKKEYLKGSMVKVSIEYSKSKMLENTKLKRSIICPENESRKGDDHLVEIFNPMLL
jgi:hypothetical protein